MARRSQAAVELELRYLERVGVSGEAREGQATGRPPTADRRREKLWVAAHTTCLSDASPVLRLLCY